jgi:hypothetical protein
MSTAQSENKGNTLRPQRSRYAITAVCNYSHVS